MKINVGTQNKVKLDAVRETVKLYPGLFPNPSVNGIDVKIDEFGHPKNLQEIINGAQERAFNAFFNCDYSIGLESGLMEVPSCDSGFVEITACVIHDGKNYYIGFGPAFEWPIEVTRYILSNKGDASKAFKDLKLTDSVKLGAEKGGIISFLTNNRITREIQIKESIIMALIYLEKSELR